MSRRRILSLSVPLVLLGIAVAAWFVLARRDADFVTVGPKTIGVRDNFAKLDTMIDPADFRDCKTVQQALRQLNVKLDGRQPPPQEVWNWWWRPARVRVDHDVFVQNGVGINLLESPFQLPAESLTLKEFLRRTFAQTGVQDVCFIVRGHYLEATTAKRAQEERARYLDSVSVYDRMHTLWKEMTGNLEEDPPELITVL